MASAAPPVAAATATSAPAKKPRDLRLDFFRGMALFFIFLNHIPNNVVSWISNRNYGFSDATEIFVFISGYSVLLAYLSVRYNEALAEEMNIGGFFEAPQMLMLQALILKFKPVNMDVLPMYIALMLAFPPIMWALLRWPRLVLAASFLLWLAVQFTHWNLPAYPRGGWFFNPLAWQFLFVLGAWCAMRRADAPWQGLPRRPFAAAAAGYLAFAFLIVLTWLHPPWAAYMPRWFARLIYPIDKTELDLLRLLHFLALAYLTILLVRPDSGFLRWRLARPVILCGQHSLHVFCTGIFLSFAAHFVLTEISPGLPAQVIVSFAGIGLMIALAGLLGAEGEARADIAGRTAKT
ncbi:MAG TPA: OpgC domain-containing protein [Ferrovibrio sp.]|uniref:OpgC family protein n=1 Tax=Ferrovibrio sp. TaxID=1917215 RepID=UPI002ED214EE